MNYPFWDVPLIGSGWVIGCIAIFHIMISHFAVGGGFYLPMAERKALREGREERTGRGGGRHGEGKPGPDASRCARASEEWLATLRGHSRFFLILTGVFGAISGVGIWFAIGLTHPEATSTLIHNFVFGWAIEWVFFMVELTTAAVYYYTWDRMIPDELHLKVGWVYAGASFCTLVIINGILTFMLTPGDTWLSVAGTGREASSSGTRSSIPLTGRACACAPWSACSLAGIWALVTTSRIDAAN